VADKVLINVATGIEKVASAEIVGATPMWEWAGNDTTVFSY
jgi:hypothetical protein